MIILYTYKEYPEIHNRAIQVMNSLLKLAISTEFLSKNLVTFLCLL